jgi:hypothetical protein
MNKEAYIQGYMGKEGPNDNHISIFDKEASALTERLRAGELSTEAWRRYVASVYPKGISSEWPESAYMEKYLRLTKPNRDAVYNLVNIFPEAYQRAKDSKHVLAGGRRIGREVQQPLRNMRFWQRQALEQIPTYQTGGLSPNNWYNLTEPTYARAVKFTRPNSTYAPGANTTFPVVPASPTRFWGSLSPGLDPAYEPSSRTIYDSPLGTPHLRHELGHWAEDLMRNVKSPQHKTMLRSALFKLRKANPQLFAYLNSKGTRGGMLDFSPLNEVGAHYLASRSGRGGGALRTVTRQNWSSPWANRLRTLYPNDPGIASVAEHLQRNYNVPGGKLISNEIVKPMLNAVRNNPVVKNVITPNVTAAGKAAAEVTGLPSLYRALKEAPHQLRYGAPLARDAVMNTARTILNSTRPYVQSVKNTVSNIPASTSAALAAGLTAAKAYGSAGAALAAPLVAPAAAITGTAAAGTGLGYGAAKALDKLTNGRYSDWLSDKMLGGKYKTFMQSGNR